jgi:hypothetical protein
MPDETHDDALEEAPPAGLAARPAEAPYEPHSDDPAALMIACPVCPAPIGAWCGGKGDVHQERHDALTAV